jgi:hypothetical protein
MFDFLKPKAPAIIKTKKKVILHAYTCVPHIAEFFAPIKMSKLTPEWWVNTPPFVDMKNRPRNPNEPPHSQELAFTVKHCYALQQLISKAVVHRLWADYMVIVPPDGRVFGRSAMQGMPGEQHPPDQYPGMVNGWAHYKFISPWVYHMDELTPFYFTHPFYHYPDPGRFQTMPGMIEFTYQNHSHTNVLFPVKPEQAEYSFNVGDPIAYLIPMADVQVEVKAEEVSRKEYEKLGTTRQITFHHHDLNRKMDIKINKPEKPRWYFPWGKNGSA